MDDAGAVLVEDDDLYLEDYVCDECFSDEEIQKFVRSEASHNACYFCKRRSDAPIAADLSEVVEFIKRGLRTEYEEIDEGHVAYDPEERDWMVEDRLDTSEVIYNCVGLPNDEDEELSTALVQALGDDLVWVEREPYAMREDEWLDASWKSFREYIMRERRFFFMVGKKGNTWRSDLVGPTEMLEVIDFTCEKCDMFGVLEAGTEIYRVRPQGPHERFSTAAELGPTPYRFARTDNRMSPVGIPMFYSGFDAETCVAETLDGPGMAAIGKFRLLRDAMVLDLTAIPEKVSIFDENRGNIVRAAAFLEGFAKDLAKHVPRDEKVHVDYVPSQVVTEYFRHAHPTIKGIVYRSARMTGHKALVLFADQTAVVGGKDPDAPYQGEPWIELSTVEERWIGANRRILDGKARSFARQFGARLGWYRRWLVEHPRGPRARRAAKRRELFRKPLKPRKPWELSGFAQTQPGWRKKQLLAWWKYVTRKR